MFARQVLYHLSHSTTPLLGSVLNIGIIGFIWGKKKTKDLPLKQV
jgi:hypothetical protein